MPYLLNLVYLALLAVAMPWLVWRAIRQGKYREGFAAKLFGRVPRRESDRTCVWLHAVSVGEVNLLGTLIGQIRGSRPDWECVVSTTTVTGMALTRKRYADLSVFYCPLDFSWAVRAALGRVRPDLLVLVELELWPNLVRAARERGARVAVINGRLSEHSFRGYRRIRPLVARVLKTIDLLAVQDETYAQRFRQLGARPETVHVTGSMKYDGAQTDRRNPATERLRRLAGFAEGEPVFLAGSTQEPEEARGAGRGSRCEASGRRCGWCWCRGTGSGSRPSPGCWTTRQWPGSGDRRWKPRALVRRPRVLLVDVIGELGAWWGTARVAFVGGSLGSRGGQNMIEPAAYGAAVCFGPNTQNFRDIVAAMLVHDAAAVVRDGDELTAFVRRCLADPAYADALGRRAAELVRRQLGADGPHAGSAGSPVGKIGRHQMAKK